VAIFKPMPILHVLTVNKINQDPDPDFDDSDPDFDEPDAEQVRIRTW